MQEFRTKIGPDGRIIIPAACRRLLHFKPGEELILLLDHDELRVFTLEHSLKNAQKAVQKYAKNKDLNKILKEMRHKDHLNE